MLALCRANNYVHTLIAHARHNINVSSEVTMGSLVVVKWVEEGKYKDLEQAIQRRFIITKQYGPGDEVKVRWGKAGRVWKVIYLGEQKKKKTTEQKWKTE